MSLVNYTQKRVFANTPEPAGRKNHKPAFRFVVQRHAASHLHYDFRLELDGVLKSWAVPKGPTLNPSDKRLAVQVEDHPVDYINFKGIIPAGNYGAGKVTIWDKGKFIPLNAMQEPVTEKEAIRALKNGELKFLLQGKKLKGEFVLVRMKDKKNWLLIKHRDKYAVDRIYNAEEEPGNKAATKIKPRLSK